MARDCLEQKEELVYLEGVEMTQLWALSIVSTAAAMAIWEAKAKRVQKAELEVAVAMEACCFSLDNLRLKSTTKSTSFIN